MRIRVLLGALAALVALGVAAAPASAAPGPSSTLSVSEDGVVFSPGPVTLLRRAGDLVPGITQRSPLRVRNETSDTLRVTLSGRARTAPGVATNLLITLTVEGNSTTVPVGRLRQCSRLVTIDLPARGIATLDVAGSLPWSSPPVSGRWSIEVFASAQSPPYDEAPADCATAQLLASGPGDRPEASVEARDTRPSVWDASRLSGWTYPFVITLVILTALVALVSGWLLRRRLRRPPLEQTRDDDAEQV